MHNQIYVFCIFILDGLIIGLLFDTFRILRKIFKTSDFITHIEDTAFWILSGLIFIFSIFKFNNGELRMFVFIGIFIGLVIYLLVVSKLYILVSVNVINTIKKVVQVLIIKPFSLIFKFLHKIFIRPTVIICVNIRKKLSNHKIKAKKFDFNGFIFKKKKDFA